MIPMFAVTPRGPHGGDSHTGRRSFLSAQQTELMSGRGLARSWVLQSRGNQRSQLSSEADVSLACETSGG